MKKLIIILVAISTFALCGYAENNAESKAEQASYPSPLVLHKKSHKGYTRSVDGQVVVSIQGNTLYIMDYLPSCTLQLVDENGDVVYEANIPEGTEQWQLPTNQLEGYELRLIIDGVCYYCVL